MSAQGFVAFDLGAESGRAMLATLHNGRLQLDELHRFANIPLRLPSGLHWNVTQLWADLLEGLRRAAATANKRNITLVSLGVDTWGVDFALLGKSGQLLGLPFAYRDERNPPAQQWAFERVGREAIYAATGIQFLPFNSLFQLIAQKHTEPAVLDHARHMLTMPDLLHYFFTGEAANEATNASTTQMVNPFTGQWAADLLTALDLPTHFLGRIAPAGAKLGRVLPHVAQATSLDSLADSLQVIAPGTHDTASAVAAVPVAADETRPWAYLSSGTWSLMGAELDQPIVTNASCDAGFTNERGVGGKIRFLKNIAGLWLVQETRRDYEQQGHSYDYAELTRLAAESEPFRTLVNPDHPPFLSPGSMLAKLRDYAAATGQPAPDSPGQAVRCCLESLALCYRRTLDALESLLGRRIELLHIVGGGGRNELLDQMTADALGRPVIVGPYEATAVGNALTQAIGIGAVKNLADLRRIVRASFDPRTFAPRDPTAFEKHLPRFDALRGRTIA